MARQESMTISRGTPLPIEDTCNDAVRVMAAQPANERNRVLVSADSWRPRTWQRQVYFIDCATLPADHKMRSGFVALDFDGNLFNERSAAVPSCRVMLCLARARPWRDRAQSKANDRAPPE